MERSPPDMVYFMYVKPAAYQVAGVCVENVNQRIPRTSAPSLLICS